MLELLPRLAAWVDSDDSRRLLDDISQKLAANEFCLVVAGQFKRGKTTFINALLGDDLLPTAIIPLTSIITEIRFGDSLAIDVLFNDGTQKNIPADQLAEYVTEKNNPRNVKDVKIVQIRHPSSWLESGVRIIDTPGIASVHDHNTDMTYSYLPNADAAIFLVSVDPPITAAEYHFLNDLRGFAARLFFVLNKIDMVGPADGQESLDFTRQVIQEQAGLEEITIFPLSARNALKSKLRKDRRRFAESGLPDFERMLESFLMEEKGQVLLDSAANKIRNVIARESFSARLMQKSLAEPLKDLEGKIALFADAETKIAQERRDSRHLVRAEANALVAEILLPDLEKLKTEKTRTLAESVDDQYNTLGRTGNRELERELNLFVHRRIHDAFDEFQSGEESILEDRLETILGRLISRTNLIINRIVSVSSGIFDIDMEPFVIDESLARESGFQFKIDEDVKVSLEAISESLTYMLPRPLAHRIILKNTRDRMAKQVDRHCGRMCHDFVERIEETIEKFRCRLDETVDATLAGIRRALEASREAHENSERGLSREEARLAERLAFFEGVLHDLDLMKNDLVTSPETGRNP